ncbi:hypothetical protein D3C79_649990 [compost metagenome]
MPGYPADVQQQPWRAGGSIDDHRFTGIDRETQHITAVVRAGGRHRDRGHARHDGIDQHPAGAGQAVEGGTGIVAKPVAQSGAVELESAGDANAIAVQLPAGDGQAEHQGAGTGTGQVVGVDRAAGIQGDRQAWRTAAGVDQHVLAEIDGEIQVLAGDIAAIGRHADTGDCRRHAIDAVDSASQATAQAVAGGIGNAGSAAIEVQAHAARPAQAVDQYRVGMAIDLGNTGDASGSAAGQHQGEIGDIHAADVFVERHRVAHRIGSARAGIDAHDTGGLRDNGIDQHRGCTAQVVERQRQRVGRRIAHGCAVQVQAARHADTIAVVVAGLHGVLEQQRVAAGA